MYVTLEPCDHQGTTPPCVDAILAAGIAKVVVGAKDPTRNGIARLREAGVEVELAELGEARVQIESWLTWARLGRPFVTYKAALTLDGRMSVPGQRWVSGEASRRLVHELRAASDAVAVGMGTVRADNPRLDARDVEAVHQPRRLTFGQGPLPDASQLELLTGQLESELERLGEQNVQSLLLESGPTLAAAFDEADLVDKVMLFLAPTISGSGPRLSARADLTHHTARAVGDDVLLTAYVHEP
jgi:diaminohydroxyphosphoribosylaminopyrimidine deaminase/5-amino-6-(5-phosphoribosylamino)uracil reductase